MSPFAGGLPSLEQGRVLVAGDLMLDRYYSGSTQRISPEAPVPVVRVEQESAGPGGAGNVAVNLAALGVKTQLIGVVGTDEAGRRLHELLRQKAIAVSLIASAQQATITKLRVLSRHQQLIRLDFESSFAAEGAFDREAWLQAFSERMAHADVVVLSDYGKGSLQGPLSLIEAVRAQGKPVIIDPKGSDFSRYRGASCLTPNLHEFEAVVGSCRDDADIEEKGQLLRQELALDALLVTRSDKGMSLLLEGGRVEHLPAMAREVYDVTGAGDTVVAVLAAGLAAGMDWIAAARLANLAAGLVVAKLGATAVTPAELLAAMGGQGMAQAVILDERTLLQRVKEARAAGQRVVMTNGCFDLLHAGHVRFLDEARRLGDLLIIAVNDDDSVRRLKGEGRPLNSVADRMAVLAGLKSVDWVLSFAEDTPARLIESILPDVLTKGADYTPDQIAGSRAVLAHGGQVICLDLHGGHSSSGLMARSAAVLKQANRS